MSEHRTAGHARTSYNPGRPRMIRQVGDALFYVESFKTPSVSYLVDLDEPSCTCPDWFHREAKAVGNGTPADCKHLLHARRFLEAKSLASAIHLPPAEIRRQLRARKDLRREVRRGMIRAYLLLTRLMPRLMTEIDRLRTIDLRQRDDMADPPCSFASREGGDGR